MTLTRVKNAVHCRSGLVASVSARVGPSSRGSRRFADRWHRRSGIATATQPAGDLNALIAQAGKDFSDYQRLTSEGKLGEAGQKLDELKQVLDRMNALRGAAQK